MRVQEMKNFLSLMLVFLLSLLKLHCLAFFTTESLVILSCEQLFTHCNSYLFQFLYFNSN